MKINQFQFGEMFSYNDCGLYIEKRPSPTVPLRDVTKTHVPGRSGDVIQDNGCFLNITKNYKVGCADIDANIAKVKKMLSQKGYQILADSYDPDFFRYGAILNAISFEEDLLNVGHASVQFDCEPYKYNIMGQLGVTVSTNSSEVTTITNPYEHSSLPRIYITAADRLGGAVTIKVNDKSFIYTFPKGYNSVNIDSFSEACYASGINFNSGYGSDTWPELAPGDNTVCVIGAKSAKVFPNWRTI